jgi:hypothetical protein
MKGSDFKQGDKFKVVSPFSAGVLTTWAAPFTGGDRKTLPVGLEFVVAANPPATATAISADVEAPKKWEELLVDREERTAERYTGYYLVIPFNDVATYCERVV